MQGTGRPRSVWPGEEGCDDLLQGFEGMLLGQELVHLWMALEDRRMDSGCVADVHPVPCGNRLPWNVGSFPPLVTIKQRLRDPVL